MGEWVSGWVGGWVGGRAGGRAGWWEVLPHLMLGGAEEAGGALP